MGFLDSCFKFSLTTVPDLGEGPPLTWVKKKKSQKEEKPAGQAKENRVPLS